MSTRGVIARIDQERGWAGNYHHHDCYPSGLGSALWSLYHGHFEHDLARMLKTLIDDHPAGWSTICEADFSLPPGWFDDDWLKGIQRPTCYCHGERHEIGRLIYPEDDFGAEWVYVFDESKNSMRVLMAVDKDGNYAIGFFGVNLARREWLEVGTFSLDGEEPIWGKLAA